MNKFLYILLILPAFFISCETEEPEIANANEISVRTMSGSFVCQPVADNNTIVTIVNNGTSNSLVKYDGHAQSLWQQSLDAYMFSGYTFDNINYIGLDKDKQNDFLVSFFALPPSVTPTTVRQFFRTIKFSNNGDYLWQLNDSVHQPDTIIIGIDTISLPNTRLFQANGFVGLSNGNYALASSLKLATADSTYIQMSYYGNDGLPVEDRYFKIPGKRDIIHVYASSNDKLFMPSTIDGLGAFYLMLDADGNVIFDLPAEGFLHDTYFMFEDSRGNYLVSASYLDNDVNIRGVILTINSIGEYTQPPVVFNMSPTWIMLSAHELSDGYIFSGFNTSTLLVTGIDWRTTFSQEEHHAVILKTDFNGSIIWNKLLSGSYYSAGAITTGNSPISFFGGKYERTNYSIFLLKYNNEGEIYY